MLDHLRKGQAAKSVRRVSSFCALKTGLNDSDISAQLTPGDTPAMKTIESFTSFVTDYDGLGDTTMIIDHDSRDATTGTYNGRTL